MKILSPSFFNKKTTVAAQDLLGKYLVRKIADQEIALMITEVEAYDGPHDLACHGRFGKTKRTETMFMPAGHFYTYLIYGTYWMLNIVTGPAYYPAAILIRGTKEVSGPGKLTKNLKIDKKFDKKLVHPKSGLWIEDRKISLVKKDIIKTPRIGVDYAGPIWSKKLYRFVLN
jgi:DNA-3-methyladenine glycosylase